MSSWERFMRDMHHIHQTDPYLLKIHDENVMNTTVQKTFQKSVTINIDLMGVSEFNFDCQ
jgi:hypothetical protein